MTTAAPTPQKYQIMPAYTPEQLADLKEDIRKHGVLTPIEKDENGAIIDGHHRHQAFEELIEEGVDLPMYDTITRRFSSEEEKIEYVLSLNIKRRHMSPEQLSELCFKLKMPPFNYSIPKIASLVGKSVGTVWNRLNTLDPEVKKQLEAAITESSDGRLMPSTYVTSRSLQTGNSVLRTMQMEAIKAIEEEMRAAGTYPVYTPPEALEQNSTFGTSVLTPPAAPSQAGGRLPLADVPEAEARERMSAFAWYGGKYSQLAWLLPLLPQCRHFVDVFGGSAAVIMNRQPSPIETYNDLDKELVHFFRTLREPARLEELLRQLVLTPYSREERRISYQSYHQDKNTEELEGVERARRFFVIARQTVRGHAQLASGDLGMWRFTRDAISRGLSAHVATWQYSIDGLATIAARFRNIQVENYPAIRIIELLDTPETLFYADPPYMQETRSTSHSRRDYTNEMSEEDHRALAAALHKIKGRAAISGFPSDLYNTLYADWKKITMPRLSNASSYQNEYNQEGAERIEVLYMNYGSDGKRLVA